MEIKTLADTSVEEVVECLLIAFSNYFVKMSPSVDYWKNRFKGARVDWAASVGLLDGPNLSAFIIHGIDSHNGELTAYNSGTGVRPEYRGQNAVDRMYEFIFPILRKKEVKKCLLEVIRENSRAIRVYRRIGFEVVRELRCFQGTIRTGNDEAVLEKIEFRDLSPMQQANRGYNSWDNNNEAVMASGNLYHTYLVKSKTLQVIGYFTLNEQTGYVAQIEAADGDYGLLLSGISKIVREVRINNVDSGRGALIRSLSSCGLSNTVNQFEMEMHL